MIDRKGARVGWKNEKRKLGDLIPWEHNPRQIRRENAARLNESLDEFGQVETIAIGPDGEVYNGHQRLNVWKERYGPDYEVEVRVSDRALDEHEKQKLTAFLHKGATGEFDMDALANTFDLDDLMDWGWKEAELVGFSTPEFKEYDESVADEVEYIECPECGYKWPK